MKNTILAIYARIKAPFCVIAGSCLAFIAAQNMGEYALSICFTFFISYLIWLGTDPNFFKKVLASIEEEKTISPHKTMTEARIIGFTLSRLGWEFFWYVWIFAILLCPFITYFLK